ncbi:MAG: hypothetical protein EB124_12400 [Betaproteobacteria bacterium]|nr:hypothetical protein [Betaproteobacteria bacterium]
MSVEGNNYFYFIAQNGLYFKDTSLIQLGDVDSTNYGTVLEVKGNTSDGNIIKIRNGEEANKDNVKISFKDKVKAFEFSTNELDLILKSETLSNNLAILEVKAFDSIKAGKIEQNWDVQQFHYTQAQIFMFGEDYTKHKNEIMNTIDKFTKTVYARLEHDYQISMKLAWLLITIINISLIILVISVQHHNKTILMSSTKVSTSKRKVKG